MGPVGYDLHIERRATRDVAQREPISLSEWKAALLITPGVRPMEDDRVSATNPMTYEVVTIGVGEGAAEVFLPDEGEWQYVFSWRRGSVIFSGRNVEVGDHSDPVWAAAVQLATHLGAVIRGDEGEIYDLETGQVVDG